MDFRDNARLDDAACGVCREPVSRERTRLLARREDLVFVELECPACTSVTLGFVMAAPGERLPDAVRLAGAPKVSRDDVLEMRRLLAQWQGDLRSLLDGGTSSSGTSSSGGPA